MEKSRLIQRLKRPVDNYKVSPFGRIDIAVEDLIELSKFFIFDYMGKAEFEFGGVRKALHKLYEDKETLTTMRIKVCYKFKNYFCTDEEGNKLEDREDSGIVWIICRKEDRKEVANRVRAYAVGHDNNRRSKCYMDDCSTYLPRSLAYNGCDIRGWLEINNGYLFFTDEKMFEKTCELFCIAR